MYYIPVAICNTVLQIYCIDAEKTEIRFKRFYSCNSIGTQRYFDTAGFPGRTLGLQAEENKKTAGT